jgi:hypothetical protein
MHDGGKITRDEAEDVLNKVVDFVSEHEAERTDLPTPTGKAAWGATA